ncbi:aminodeoxychorismate synthase component I [Nitrogeniibacter mangrovi]|uniref:Aminodeoxychorismate synthase component I n=1 Tax=Nitrogeniibacter mangrovi TaxID=2016596 RepID=A0A6C1B6R4_9RHOO|nr:aminodeoxychorismate synthase component I [Nitrogeniibacter mangrovi]QID17980.1 aminodeoxychorismate synthase component I [Nitrogeniibacter mangrovi]
MFASDTPSALFDSNLDGQRAIRLTGLVEHIRCTDPADVLAAFARIDAAGRQGHWVALAAAYELGYVFEPRLAPRRPADDTPLLEAWIFAHCDSLADAAVDAWLAEADGPAGLLDFTPAIERAAYLEAVTRIRHYIAAGDCYQTNFTFPCRARAYGSARALYRQLRAAQPVRYGALIEHAHGALLSRSPELFVERLGERLVCRPMKGTAPAAAEATALTDSAKNRAENVMIVDLIRNDLGRLVPPGHVKVTRLFEAERYRTVWQMTSTIVAHSAPAPLYDIFRALFPCGSITGAPKVRAMEIIRELERAPRGIYCGALGWIAPHGDFAFNVPIRTLEIRRDGRTRCGTGSGIVFDSVPDEEWRECLLKTAFLADLPESLALIETIRCNGGLRDPLPWLDDHLDRLCGSAAQLGIPCDRARIEAALRASVARLQGAHRVRLTLSIHGEPDITCAPLGATPCRPSVILAEATVDAGDPMLRHKSTARALYDRTLAAATAAGHFDALFFNTRGELTEGCRSNVFVEVDGDLLTPARACGLLDGVCRRRLIRAGRVRETVLTRDDLQRAQRIYVGNALRGLIEVRLATR